MGDAPSPVGPATRPTALPGVTLPKGGGALRGIGEKFAANPVTGTGAMTVPIATSPGRSGIGPELGLAYDSGAGNGIFGFGWTLGQPAITRKTDKGLPRYDDAGESDVFLLSGSEDLVPVPSPAGDLDDTSTDARFVIRRYRPRVDSLFARIERWTTQDGGDVHWRSISRENVLTLYGRDAASRIADPADATRIFSWLISETRDDRGNAVVYDYAADDGAGVDPGDPWERNRGAVDDARRTTNRYPRAIRYGNRRPLLDAAGRRPRFLPAEQRDGAEWMFEVVFDYGDHDVDDPAPEGTAEWGLRQDAFSSYRAGFEVRTTRLCRRVLMFHHIPDGPDGQPGYDGLVRSTDLGYSGGKDSQYAFLRSVTQVGYRRVGDGYRTRSLPPLEFEYTEPTVQDTVEDVDPAGLRNLPGGVGPGYQWVDLHGEGVPGILSEQAGAWFYTRNLSPVSDHTVRFSAQELVATQPSVPMAAAHAEFMDVAGDGQQDLVVLDGPVTGFFEHDGEEGWAPFRPFRSRPDLDFRRPDLRFVDLDGDGHADVLITGADDVSWYPSQGEDGFGPALRVVQPFDEESGPRLVFADGDRSIYLADLSGDGLSDLARVRNGEVCYWPNLGHGRFGAKVTMGRAASADGSADDGLFDDPDHFDQSRIRLADIDGTGTTDLVYLHRDGVRLYFNRSGNSWSPPHRLDVFPRVDDVATVGVADLLGNGTACLTWSSPLAGDAARPMRYVNLMGADKPHLLVRAVNNLGAETAVRYAPSTTFFLQDRAAGTPWVTRLPFPVHVVERVETRDRISRNRFVHRYAYHDGYFDGEEREFRGFGTVDEWDTEEIGALTSTGQGPADDEDPAGRLPPVHTRTWFHTGAPGAVHVPAGSLETPPPPEGLTVGEQREAARALKGTMLRREVYGLDGSPRQEHPYTVSESTAAVRLEQRRDGRRHAVFTTHPVETVERHSERRPDDARVHHTITLEVDRFGNALKSVAIGYGRSSSPLPEAADRERQTTSLLVYTERVVTSGIDDIGAFPDDHRAPMPAETRSYELTGYPAGGPDGRYLPGDFVEPDPDRPDRLRHRVDREFGYEESASGSRARRVIEWERTLYRADALTGLLPLGGLEPRSLTGQTYRLAFTAGLLAQVFQRDGLPLLPDPAAVLGGPGGDRGGYLAGAELTGDGRFPATDPDGLWWLPGPLTLLSPDPQATGEQELDHAVRHFFLPWRTRDAFHTEAVSTESAVRYDDHDLFVVETLDAVGNRVSVSNDYRVLQPARVTDINGNGSEVAFDAMGLVVGAAVLGKPGQETGDSLAGFEPDLSEDDVRAHLADPMAAPQRLLGGATSRLVRDLFAYLRTRDEPTPAPTAVGTVARETHVAETPGDAGLQITVSYSDGFGREIQKKVRAEPGPLVAGGPVSDPRWVGTGWVVFNGKGLPVRQYEPFFTATPAFEFGVARGVSPVLFYDPLGRAMVTLHPDSSYQKVVFDAWEQTTWDRNDTVADDPRTDSDTAGHVAAWFAGRPADAPPWRTWREQRQAGGPEQDAATKAAAHAATPTRAHADALGRLFLTTADNGVDPDHPDRHVFFRARVDLDIEGNQRAVRDADLQGGDPLGRVVVRYACDVLGRRIHQSNMESGARWRLDDAAGEVLREWDVRGHTFRNEYDPARRPVRTFVTGVDPADPGREVLTDRLVYGEQHPEADQRNLRGHLHLHLDQAGAVATETRDVRGNVSRTSRRLTAGTRYRALVDWRKVDDEALSGPATGVLDLTALGSALAPILEADEYTAATTYDALSRVVTSTTPHTPGMAPSDLRPSYNEAGLLERVDVRLRDQLAEGVPVWTPFVTGIDYDAKGRRSLVRHGNGVETAYGYDPLTHRLVRVRTTRDASAFPDDRPEPPSPGWPGGLVQDLQYTYDPVGNVTSIRDDAQQRVFFSNRRVEPSSEHTYDATYRLMQATGREHVGQGGMAVPHSADDALRSGLPHPGDGLAMATYVERYVYDAAGNLAEMRHTGGMPAQPGWTRSYTYAESSLLEDGTDGTTRKTSNRLSSTTVGGTVGSPVETYRHDAHGNMTRLPHLGGDDPAPNLEWDHLDRLHRTDRDGGGTAWYVYDAAGDRVRKVWEKSTDLVEERIYLGGFEIYRRRHGDGLLERETLHVMDGEQPVALVEVRTADTAGTDRASEVLVRYQYGNHLGSACLELDDRGRVISYEEYTPYGSSSYQAVAGQTEAPKRYRFTGKERDEETGLNHHAARYYAPWLGRWTAADPIGVAAGPNAFSHVRDNPITLVDPGGSEDQPAAKKEVGFLTKVGIGVSVGFTLVTGQTPSHFGQGVVDKAKSLTVEPVMVIFGPRGMLDMAAQKAVDRSMGVQKPDEYYGNKETQSARLGAIVAVGGALFPGVGPAGATAAGPPLALATEGGGVAVAAGTPALTQAPALVAAGVKGAAVATGGSTSASQTKKAPDLPADSAARAPATVEARATYIHDRFGESIVGKLKPKTFATSDSPGALGTRVADHFDASTGTLYEFNTTPWSELTEKNPSQIVRKIEQVGKDFQLRQTGEIKQAIWYGTEELPQTGPAAGLRKALMDAKIEYRVVPLPPELAQLRPPVR
jgi:RHS repeat-associated protein